MDGQDTAPAVIFRSPSTEMAQSSLSTAEYIAEVARCISEAAQKGMIQDEYRFKPGRVQSLKKVGSCMDLLEILVSSDRERRAWMQMEAWGDMPGISPEVNFCVSAIRAMLRRDAVVRVETENLLVLRGLISTHGTAPEETPA